jgi:hypothetical protein
LYLAGVFNRVAKYNQIFYILPSKTNKAQNLNAAQMVIPSRQRSQPELGIVSGLETGQEEFFGDFLGERD